MTEIRSVDREILTNEVKVTFSSPLRCPDFEAFLRNNITLKQYNLLLSLIRSTHHLSHIDLFSPQEVYS